MPLNKSLKRVMIIGSGPIVIGQAAEFDYAGTQACRALKEAGLEVILVNSNPATIMTDKAMADRIYIEPLTLEILKRIILKERPDGLLSTLGGQTGLTLSMQLAKDGFLDQYGVQLLGARSSTIDKAEDRYLFKQTMLEIGQPVIPSDVVTDVDAALVLAETLGYPVIVRPAFTLGGNGGGIAETPEALAVIARRGIRTSPIGQILVEKSIAGWKEIEFEVMRDAKGNSIAVCSMENLDPVGIHTGDSIVIAPAVTLADKEYQMLRSAALNIINSLEVEGGCNVQFAMHPTSFEYAVIEVNPRVSRSSALASKATGYPIAKVAAQIAVGFTLDEIPNAITHKTYACFEPTLDYVVVKIPKWPFDKFVYGNRKLGTQMKATGEVMSIATNFEAALLKAVRGVEIGLKTLTQPKFAVLSDEQLKEAILQCTDERLFLVYEALKRGVSVDTLHQMTMIDNWFLYKLVNILEMERVLAKGNLSRELYVKAKHMGLLDSSISQLSGCSIEEPLAPVYKMVDTCAAEFEAHTPYFYSTFDTENEAELKDPDGGKKRVVIFGSGPIRIGQGIEFDYASVHCVWALREMGYEVIMVNNNPETVSTDFDTADRLYFEPLTPEDAMHIVQNERPIGAVVAFGGQTAINLTKHLAKNGVPILGTSSKNIDLAEDRKLFDELLEKIGLRRPRGETVFTKEQAFRAAKDLGYPVLIRPSYVLGGQNMVIAFSEQDIDEYMDIILSSEIENPILIDKYIMGLETEVDVICDGKDVLIPGIMAHIERAGVHSGDSIAMYPAKTINGVLTQKLIDNSTKLALALETRGLINIQYVIQHNEIYIIEANPRASRTVPYISKVTGVPMVDIATRVMMGEKLKDLGYGTGLYPAAPYCAVKVPVFSFEKLADVDTHLGPEMKSTGEVLGVGRNFEEALYKGLTAAGYDLKLSGGILFTVADNQKPEIAEPARKFAQMGFSLYASEGTAKVLRHAGLQVEVVGKLHEGSNNIIDLMEAGKIQYVISTSTKGRLPQRDSVKMRRKTVELSIACLTSIDTANALADALASRYGQGSVSLIDITRLRKNRQKLQFIKMRTSGNDYIYFDCFAQEIDNPGSLSVLLTNRRKSIGADGIVLIYPCKVADAKMRMFNADGSEGEVSGNALRCVAKYLYESGRVPKMKMSIQTNGGRKQLSLLVINQQVVSVTVDMGLPDFASSAVPVTLGKERVIDHPIHFEGQDLSITCLSMGNPHCVIFCEDVDMVPLWSIGPKLENAPFFPHRANISFASVQDNRTLRMRVWERGIGETWACGTGACAVVAAATELKLCERGKDITVKLKGGNMVIRYDKDGLYMTGDAQKDFEGTIEV